MNCDKCGRSDTLMKPASGWTCVECINKAQAKRNKKNAESAEWRAKNKERVKKNWQDWRARQGDSFNERRKLTRVGRAGLTGAQAAEIVANQGGGCGICGREIVGLGRHRHVDHCHTTGKVRGILCNNCNLGLGHFKDSPETLALAIAYLKKN